MISINQGVLQNGEVVAVKRLLVVAKTNLDKQYLNEVSSLIDLNHRNIVKLFGYCNEIQRKLVESHGTYVFADTEERILCYEYLPRGSLDKYLYGILLSHSLSGCSGILAFCCIVCCIKHPFTLNSRLIYVTSCGNTRKNIILVLHTFRIKYNFN